MRKRILVQAFQVEVSWILFVVVFLVELVLLWWYFRVSGSLEKSILFCATVVGGTFALYTYIRHDEEVRLSYSQRLIERWNSLTPEFETCKDLLSEAYLGSLAPLKSYARTRTAPAPGGTVMMPGPKELLTRKRILGLLNYCEELATAVNMNTADEESLRRMLGHVITVAWNSFEEWITLEGAAIGSDDAYVELKKLAARWKN